MKKEIFISRIKDFKKLETKIKKTFTQIYDGINDDFISQETLHELNMVICEFYERGILFTKELCEIYWKK